MVQFFYGLPIWLATILVLGLALAVGLGSSFGLRRLFRLHSSDDDAETAVSLMQVVAAYIGILLAFAGVQVWQDFTDAQNAVHKEAAAASQLYRDMATYGPETRGARVQLRAYVASITTDEWPLLSQGQASPKTETKLFQLFAAVGKVRPADNRDTTIYTEIFSNLNDLVGLRRDRLIHSESGMPIILWVVGLFGSVLIVAYTATFHVNRVNILMISGISLALGLVFLFILVVDRPFLGEFSVSSHELEGLSQRFDVLDRLSGT
ncbi:MAG TPA: hypothetical protein VF098_07960 [Sphingomicrobium sp.]|jgi:hypothetical protein